MVEQIYSKRAAQARVTHSTQTHTHTHTDHKKTYFLRRGWVHAGTRSFAEGEWRLVGRGGLFKCGGAQLVRRRGCARHSTARHTPKAGERGMCAACVHVIDTNGEKERSHTHTRSPRAAHVGGAGELKRAGQ